jgi:hypothetical protein
MSRLTWAQARAVLAGLFAEWPEQWPQRLAPVHLARLQAPPNGGDWTLTRAFEEAIAGACAAGELAHEGADFTFPPLVAWANLEESPEQMRARWRAQCITKSLPAVAACDFVAWLRAQGATPSDHSTAWVQATAAEPAQATAAAASSTHKTKRRADPLAAVLDLAARQALDSTDWQSVWAALVALAQHASRPAPLLGYVEGEGVQYRADDADQPAGYLTRDAFRKRFKRKG